MPLDNPIILLDAAHIIWKQVGGREALLRVNFRHLFSAIKRAHRSVSPEKQQVFLNMISSRYNDVQWGPLLESYLIGSISCDELMAPLLSLQIIQPTHNIINSSIKMVSEYKNATENKLIDEKFKKAIRRPDLQRKETEQLAKKIKWMLKIINPISIDEKKSSGYLCSLTNEIMSDPVKLSHTPQMYERVMLEQWLVEHDTCPATNIRLQEGIVSTEPCRDVQVKIHCFLLECDLQSRALKRLKTLSQVINLYPRYMFLGSALSKLNDYHFDDKNQKPRTTEKNIVKFRL